jgi:hypothetical protein
VNHRSIIGALSAAFALVGCNAAGNVPSTSNLISASFRPAAPSTDTFAPAKSVPKANWSGPSRRGSLLYVSANSFVNVYLYPTRKLVGTITGLQGATGLCADKSGNIWVDDSEAYEILEFAHGGTNPIETLSDSYGPQGCAVDSKTGDLAVTSYAGAGGKSTRGAVSIYSRGRGTPTVYRASAVYHPYFCGYDDKGDLFVDGVKGSKFEFASLMRGHGRFANVALDQPFSSMPGAVQWDGKHIAVGDQRGAYVFQFDIKGSVGTEVGSIGVKTGIQQFWIQHNTIVGPDGGDANVTFWTYPGGALKQQIRGLEPYGAAVSVSPK